MLKVSLDVVPTLNAALIPLSPNKEAIQRLLVDGKIGLVSPNQRLATKTSGGLSSDDLSLVAFFAHEDVQLLIGSTAKYVDTISECQLKDEGYCNHNLKTRVTGEERFVCVGITTIWPMTVTRHFRLPERIRFAMA